MVHNFRISFIPISIKIFNREIFLLNRTDAGIIVREHLFAWTFPKSYPPPELVYNIEEPPKFGILYRKLADGKKRRIGVSSNFTQQDIDEGLISFKLHFTHYAIVNDFFIFRVLTPAVNSASSRFEIVYMPPETSVQLVNRTIVVTEGKMARITSEFLSLTTPDETNFIFQIIEVPKFGALVLEKSIGDVILKENSNFTMKDVASGKLNYSHAGEESKEDYCILSARSSTTNTQIGIPFWLTFSVILVNDNSPKLVGKDTIYIVERGQRLLHDELLKWRDDDIHSPALIFNFAQPFKV